MKNSRQRFDRWQGEANPSAIGRILWVDAIEQAPKATTKSLLCSAFCVAFLAMAAQGIATPSSVSIKLEKTLAKDAQRRDQSGKSAVIVKLKAPLNSVQKKALQGLGASIYRDLPVIKSVALELPVRNLVQLSSLPFVEHVSTDAVIAKTDAFADSHSMATQAWANLAATKTNLALNNVVIGFLDSGINQVPDLPNILNNQSFVLGDTTTTDLCGHGTDVAGIALGNGRSSTGAGFTQTYTGVLTSSGPGQAPQVMSMKVLGPSGQGRVSDVIVGMSWFLLVASGNTAVNANIPKNSRFVLNLSIGHPVTESYTTDPLCQTCELLEKMGVVVVCAAGNNGRVTDTPNSYPDNEGYGTNYGSVTSPGNDPYVITVGAMKNIDGNRAHDTIATYSSRGPSILDHVVKPDIVAPGNQVVSIDGSVTTGPNTTSTWLDQNYPSIVVPLSSYWSGQGGQPKNGYITLSGTSMATPVVTAAAAMMLAQDTTLSPDTVKARLMLTADKWSFSNGTGDPCTFGAGYVNIANAMASKIVATSPALSPTLSEDAQGNVFLTNNGFLSGTRAIWGSSINDLRAIWGVDAVTSTGYLDANRAIWGSGFWGASGVTATSTFQADFSSHVIYGEGK